MQGPNRGARVGRDLIVENAQQIKRKVDTQKNYANKKMGAHKNVKVVVCLWTCLVRSPLTGH